MDGVLLVDKPAGWTSHDVVAKVRSIIKSESGQKIKVGHTGTLDPMATGLLVLVLGSYTKRAGDFSKLDKVYAAELTLGAVSSTGDLEGEITQLGQRQPAAEELEGVLRQYLGKIQQTPHLFSAVKVGGQRAYKLARKGQKVELEPRKVTIYEISVLSYKYPKLRIQAKVSSGTYIRSLAEDIGRDLDVGAYLTMLHRIQVGRFKIEQAVDLERLTLATISSSIIK
jgi:tRNA pseudouridine55 synthase